MEREQVSRGFSGRLSPNFEQEPGYTHPPEQTSDILSPLLVAAGESELGPWEDFYTKIKLPAIEEEARFYKGTYREVDPTPGENHMRERFGISDKPEIIQRIGGSNRIIADIPRWLLREMSTPNGPKKIYVQSLGLTFPTLAIETRPYQRAGLFYGNIEYPIGSSHSDNIARLTDRVKKTHGNRAPTVLYVCNPTNPTGDTVEREQLRDLAEACQEEDKLLIIDEAYGDYLPDENSAIPLTEEIDGLIVLRSWSKGIGLANERFGYAVTSPPIGSRLKSTIEKHPMPALTQLIANRMTPELIYNHLTHVREAYTAAGVNFRRLCKEANIQLLPHDKHERVPIVAVTSGKDVLSGGRRFDTYMDELGIDTASGAGFHTTHSQADASIQRLTKPLDPSLQRELIRRLQLTKYGDLLDE